MKIRIIGIAIVLSLFATVSIAGKAQSTSLMSADIPFDFMIGEKKLHKGEYQVTRESTSVIQLYGKNNHESAFGQFYGGKSSRRPSDAKLVFIRYGERYFLTQVWAWGDTTAKQLLTTKAERELMKQSKNLARNAIKPETVIVLGQ